MTLGKGEGTVIKVVADLNAVNAFCIPCITATAKLPVRIGIQEGQMQNKQCD